MCMFEGKQDRGRPRDERAPLHDGYRFTAVMQYGVRKYNSWGRGAFSSQNFLVKIFCFRFEHMHEILNAVKQQN